MEDETSAKKKKKSTSNLLKDDRFKALFSNPDFQVDANSEEYALLNPVISQLERSRAKRLKAAEEARQKMEIDHESDDNEGIVYICYVINKLF